MYFKFCTVVIALVKLRQYSEPRSLVSFSSKLFLTGKEGDVSLCRRFLSYKMSLVHNHNHHRHHALVVLPQVDKKRSVKKHLNEHSVTVTVKQQL